MPGVYMILDTTNGKVYVGSTTKSFSERWDRHRADLGRNRHDNPHLQASWNKYGEVAFKFLVLQEAGAEDVLNSEQAWLDFFRGVGKGIYNCALVVAAPFLGRRHSEETLQKMRVSQKGRQITREHRRKLSETLRNIGSPKSKSYPSLYNKNTGEIIPPGVNRRGLCRERGWDHSSFRRLINDDYHSMKGWVLMSEISIASMAQLSFSV